VIQKLNYLASGVCWCSVLLKGVKVTLSLQKCESNHFLSFFVAAMVKLQQFAIGEPDKFTIEAEQLFSKSVSIGCDKQVCARGTL